MLPDRVSNPGPLTYESGALPIALRGPAQSVTRRRAEINNGHSTYFFCGIIPLCNFQYRNRVRSITLILIEIISQNLVEI